MPNSLATHLKSLPETELELLLSSLDQKSLAMLAPSIPSPQTDGEIGTAKKPITDSDFIQKIYAFLLLSLEIFKAALACLLFDQLVLQCGAQICSLEDLKASNYKFVFMWNYLTFTALVIHYGICWYRERFLVEYFDQDPSVPSTNLDIVLSNYPAIQTYLVFYNRLSLLSGSIFLITSLFNFYFSSILSFRYYSPQSLSTILSSLILLFSILLRSLTASLTTKVMSMVQMEMVAFNQIDSDHIGDKGKVISVKPWYLGLLDVKHKHE